MLNEARDHFFETYRAIQPVIEALKVLVKTLTKFQKSVGHMPRFSLGLPHYEYMLKEARTFKKDAYDTACAIGSLSRDGQDND